MDGLIYTLLLSLKMNNFFHLKALRALFVLLLLEV